MIIRLSTSLVWQGREYHSGDDIDLPDELAWKYIRAGSAEQVTPPIETAALITSPPQGKRNVRNTAART